MLITSANFDVIIDTINRQLIASHNQPLTPPEIMILRGTWQYLTYNQIALEEGYSPGYFTNVVAPELFKRLSQLIGKRVTKKNCQVLLQSYAQEQIIQEKTFIREKSTDFSVNNNHKCKVLPPYPSGSIALDSPYYIKRSPVEEQAYEEIGKPGALVRIKAPQEMGKTSLLLRILDYASRQGYRTVSLNLQQIDESILNDLNRFLRWLCANVTYQLKLEPRLDGYWDEDIGTKISCTLYFQEYLLEQIKQPFVLALDEVNRIFEHPQIAKDVLPLLRSWHEEAKRIPSWQKLRLIVVHSTEIYVPLQLKQSPFNVGLPIQLDGFSLEQVQQLAQRYGINWKDEKEARQIMDLVGGHPALINIALYHLHRTEMSLSQLLETASTTTGIYNYHLQRHWAILEEQPELLLALNYVINATEPVSLEPIIVYKLSSMGLIKQLGNKVIPSCELYRQSFIKK
ncbi:MAG: AAA-like domain-containing protein [Calothrix sp. MO_167.B12]|nr:AAA-like domain-containing protein [Calothrix sp. MO_167.B12]